MLFQDTLVLSNRCSLQCMRCSLWNDSNDDLNDTLAESVLDDLINANKDGSYSSPAIVNVVGGEPFLEPRLLSILQLLRAMNKKNRVWTNGVGVLSVFEQIYSFIDSLVVFLPTYQSNDYIDVTGRDGWSEVNAFIEFSRDLSIPLLITTIARPETIQWLPELYEVICYRHQLPFVIQYFESEPWSTDSIAFIDRYRWIKRVGVVKRSDALPHICPAVGKTGAIWSDQWRFWWAETVQTRLI